MAKFLFILGAGASHGSDNDMVTPPLGGSELFNALASFNPSGWGKLTKAQTNLFKEDFEKGMEEIFKIQPSPLFRLQKAMAEYFFEFDPASSNLYIQLAKVIKDKNIDAKFATLNYDRLLEISLQAAGFKMTDFRGKAQNDIEVCFPHGSCNFFCKSITAPTATQVTFTDADDGTSITGGLFSKKTSSGNVRVGMTSKSTTQGRVEKVTDAKDFRNRLSSDVLPPVMSYFVPSKNTTSCVDFIEAQRERFYHLVIEAYKIIIIIGLQVREHDTHIWQPLSKTDNEIIYCSGATAGKKFQSWCENHRRGKEQLILPVYFKDGFRELCAQFN